MIIMDDEEIVLPPNSGPKPIVPGRVELQIENNKKAPIEETFQKVLLKLTGEQKSRSGLDLVAVLDVSKSMRGDKLEKLKTAMLFVMKKLGLEDRLSIIKYSSKAEGLCPLRQMTESSRMELEGLIKGLRVLGGTNISDGLETALKVFKSRKISDGRVGAIILMSDGEQTAGPDATHVKIDNVPVHTFGFGDGQDPKVLNAIAQNSLGGTYSDVRMENLNLAFSLCLGGLLSVVAQELTVTVTQIEGKSKINQVLAGRYLPPPSPVDNSTGSVTINFGDLYIKEVRKVFLELHLPATDKKGGRDILKVEYKYRFNGELSEANPSFATVNRVAVLTPEEKETLAEVRAEEVRLQIAEVIKQATNDADNKQLKRARDKLVEGMETLGDDDREKLKAELRAELQELHDLMKTPEIYDKQGRPFAYSLLTSHATQRQAAKGKDIGKFQLFATPAMQEFLKEAESYDNINELETYIDEVLDALADIEKIVENV